MRDVLQIFNLFIINLNSLLGKYLFIIKFDKCVNARLSNRFKVWLNTKYQTYNFPRIFKSETY